MFDENETIITGSSDKTCKGILIFTLLEYVIAEKGAQDFDKFTLNYVNNEKLS